MMRLWLCTLLAVDTVACAAPRTSPPREPAPAVSVSAPPPVETAMRPVPALPEGVFLQLWLPDTGDLFRVAADGRYLVTSGGGAEVQAAPMSQHERGAPVVSATGIARLDAALTAAGFFDLPASVPGEMPGDGVVLSNGGRAPKAVALVFSARRGAAVATVRVEGDPRAPATLGALAPVYVALDREALGGWAAE